ncbi:MAG: AAA domain-containing protein [bacterium]
MNLKLGFSKKSEFDKDLFDFMKEISSIPRVKLSTNAINIERSNKDATQIKSLKGVKMVIKTSQGSIIAHGNLGVSFVAPMGLEFYVLRLNLIKSQDYDSMKGYETPVTFTSSTPTSIDNSFQLLNLISKHEDFCFNISQFDDFMEIFNFYKELNNEINNNASFEIINTTQPYYFIPINNKINDVSKLEEVFNKSGILKGYRVPTFEYNDLSQSDLNHVIELVDIKVNIPNSKIKLFNKLIDSIYVSNYAQVDDHKAKSLLNVEIFNVLKNGDDTIVSCSYDGFVKHKYLNIYDMGQKIKIDSIDNSLKLIKQGASGSAAELLEYILGDKPLPDKRSLLTSIKQQYTANLDEHQIEAFLKATDGSPVTLIKGPPGTGKTHVINAIVQYITKELKEKVIISSQTHVAIDNVLDKLMKNHDIIIPNRISNRRNKYSSTYIDKTLYETWGELLPKHLENLSSSLLSEKILNDISKFTGNKTFTYSRRSISDDYMVLGATTTTSSIGGKKGMELLKDYNWLIIDEVSKCPITEVLRYLPYVDKIIMVGDDYQLAPLLEFNKEEVSHLNSFDEDKFEILKKTYEQSVFADVLKKAKKDGRLVTLKSNYRSVKPILDCYNLFYNGDLINKRELVSEKHTFLNHSVYNKADVVFIEVLGGKEVVDSKKSRYNIEEMRATASILETLIKDTKNPRTVSVSAIFPYSAQINRFDIDYKELINTAKKTFMSFDMDTVDAFQGKESDIVLVNTVVADKNKRNFLNDFRRINVSVSRAKDKLFIFGNSGVLSNIEMKIDGGVKRTYFREIIDNIRRSTECAIVEYRNGEEVKHDTSKPKFKLI